MRSLRFATIGALSAKLSEIRTKQLGNVRTHRINDPQPKPSKYKNRRCKYEGQSFDSLKELARWKELLLLQKAGKISELRRQVSYQIKVKGVEICTYRPDFVYKQGGTLIVVDVKGMRKGLPYRVFRIKAALMLACFGITVVEV